ncbi:hypothetical protein D3C74_227650 [compost metagenome]
MLLKKPAKVAELVFAHCVNNSAVAVDHVVICVWNQVAQVAIIVLTLVVQEVNFVIVLDAQVYTANCAAVIAVLTCNPKFNDHCAITLNVCTDQSANAARDSTTQVLMVKMVA